MSQRTILKHILTADGQAEYVETVEAVAEYRRLVALRDAQDSEIGKSEYKRLLNMLNVEWHSYNSGEDAELADLAKLYEMRETLSEGQVISAEKSYC